MIRRFRRLAQIFFDQTELHSASLLIVITLGTPK